MHRNYQLDHDVAVVGDNVAAVGNMVAVVVDIQNVLEQYHMQTFGSVAHHNGAVLDALF